MPPFVVGFVVDSTGLRLHFEVPWEPLLQVSYWLLASLVFPLCCLRKLGRRLSSPAALDKTGEVVALVWLFGLFFIVSWAYLTCWKIREQELYLRTGQAHTVFTVDLPDADPVG